MTEFIICDRDNLFAAKIQDYIKQYIKQNNIKGRVIIYSKDYNSLLMHLASNTYVTRLYFLDIVLGEDTNGLILARKIRDLDLAGEIVFITNHPEFSFDVLHYKLKALDYLFKDDINLKSKVFECLDAASLTRKPLETEAVEKTFTIQNSKESHIVLLKDILFFETDTVNRFIILHLKDRQIPFRGTLETVMKKLDNSFWRCHRSYIVNLRYVKRISKKRNEMFVELSTGDRCMYSKKYSRRMEDREPAAITS